jgi:hypothetical protein
MKMGDSGLIRSLGTARPNPFFRAIALPQKTARNRRSELSAGPLPAENNYIRFFLFL